VSGAGLALAAVIVLGSLIPLAAAHGASSSATSSAASAAGAPAPASAGVQLTDDRGRTHAWPVPPQRIVSLLPSLAESVCELGECRRLVGVDRYTNWPAELDALPRVGGGMDPGIEAIVALRPEVVLVQRHSRAIDRLEALGLKVVALEPRSHADVRRTLGTLARLLGQDEAAAARVWRRIDAGVSAAAQSLPARPAPVRVYFEVNPAPYAAGESSFIGETLTRLGVRNIVPASLGPFPKLNPEFVVRANPDLILLSERGSSGLAERPGWRTIRAVREQRVCVFTAAEGDVLVRPGPRMAEAAQLMARCLRDKAP
jgi:iron complex transport system substrate-binding protein